MSTAPSPRTTPSASNTSPGDSVTARGAAIPTPKQKRSFLAEFVKNPTATGAVAPSSRYLAELMVATANVASADIVVEYGPGTGAFSPHVHAALKPGARFFAIELSQTLSDLFRQSHPQIKLYTGSVADVSSLLQREGLPPKNSVDAIISGLPWASFPRPLQQTLLDATMDILKPGGVMVTFAYVGLSMMTAAGRRFRKLLPEYFESVTTAGPVMRNVPPAFVFRCVKAM
jgi:phosphatidylethanolamine/phosphatidyl-N-methylethanolamine N-methyltransferase